MSRNFQFAEGEYFHIYNRGTDKRTIFQDESDYKRFITLLYLCNGSTPVHLQIQGRTLKEAVEIDRGDPLVGIGAYCLMPNHFHILVRETKQGGISKFMQKVGNAYTGYFNKRNERTGSLFQGKFRASHASRDEYLKYLISYIHLNPVKLFDPQWKVNGIIDKNAAQDFLDEFPYSSYPDYRGVEREENKILTSSEFPEYFETSGDFNTCVSEWLTFNGETNILS